MDIQEIIRKMNEERKANASNLTIGDMLSKLEQFDDDTRVLFTNGLHFDGSYDSYRGYYEDMYLGMSSVDTGRDTIGNVKDTLQRALNDGIMYGYKGGEYSITNDTLVWFTTYGRTGDMIVDVQSADGIAAIVVQEDE